MTEAEAIARLTGHPSEAITTILAALERAEKDAALWRKWAPWMRGLNKKPFDLAMHFHRENAALLQHEQGASK